MGWGMGVSLWTKISTPQNKAFLHMGPQIFYYPNALSSPALPNLWLLPVFEKLLCLLLEL